jgi:hypothetical protein
MAGLSGALLFCTALFCTATTASAHSVLLHTTPKASSEVPAAPDSVVLSFNEMPRARFSAIHVIGPDGTRRDSGSVRVVNDSVTQVLSGGRPAGAYTVDWRVISADGHPVSGQFTFRAAAAAAPLAPEQSAAPTASSSGKSGGGGGRVALIVAVIAVIAIAVATFIWQRRARGHHHAAAAGDDDCD